MKLIDVLQEIRQEIEQLKGTFPKEYYIKLIDKHIKEIENEQGTDKSIK